MDFGKFVKEAAEVYAASGGNIKTPIEGLAYLALIHTEVSEAVECVRKNDVEPRVSEKGKPEGLPSELADIVLRTMIFAESQGVDLEAAMRAKHEYNARKRPSLKAEGKVL